MKDNKRLVTGVVGTGELVGQMALITGNKCPISVTAVERVELIPIPGEKILTIVNSQPKWIKLMLESLSRRLDETIKRIS